MNPSSVSTTPPRLSSSSSQGPDNQTNVPLEEAPEDDDAYEDRLAIAALSSRMQSLEDQMAELLRQVRAWSTSWQADQYC